MPMTGTGAGLGVDDSGAPSTIGIAPSSFRRAVDLATADRRPNPVRLGLMVLDLATVVVVQALATVLFIDAAGASVRLSWANYAWIAVLSWPGWIIAFAQQRLYSSRYLGRAVDELRRLIFGVAIGVAYMAFASVILRQRVERSWFVVIGGAVLLGVGLERAVVRKMFQRWRASGRMQRRVVIVGDNQEGKEIARLLTEQPELGYLVVGPVHPALPADGVPDFAVVVDETVKLVRSERADSVIIAVSAVDFSTSNLLIRALADRGVHVEMSSTLLDISVNRITVHSLGRFPVMHIQPVRRDGWRSLAKRSFDVVFAAILLIITAPMVLIAAVAIKATSRGPIFFRQVRIGQEGASFTLYKMRTMVENAELLLPELSTLNEQDGPLFKVRQDPRVTPIGRVLRSISFDELPQLWNVLRGDMALVGPRPALPSEVEAWPRMAFQRLRVRPGLTGMWQVSGRSSTRFEEYVRLDLYYVDNWSLVTDVAIILRTIPSVFSRRGAC